MNYPTSLAACQDCGPAKGKSAPQLDAEQSTDDQAVHVCPKCQLVHVTHAKRFTAKGRK